MADGKVAAQPQLALFGAPPGPMLGAIAPASPYGPPAPETRQAAQEASSRFAQRIRDEVLVAITAAGAGGLTSDEAAACLGYSVLTVRPRCTELVKAGRIRDTGVRRRNASGRMAAVWGPV